MKILLALTLTFLLGITGVQAQWVPQMVPANTGQIRYIDIIDSNVIWAMGNGTTFSGGIGIIRTTNRGNTWSAIPVNIPGLNGQFEIYSLEALDANTAFIVVSINFAGSGPPTRVFKTTDAGLTWTAISGIYTTQGSWAGFVQFFDANNGVIVGDNREIYTTNNAGNTWTAVPAANLPAPTGADYTLDRRTVLGNTIWVPTGGMRIYKSIDKGLTWTVSNTNIPSNTPGFGDIIVGLAFQDSNNGLANHGNNLSRTTDGGQTWTPVTHTGAFFMFGITHVPGMPNTFVNYSILAANPGISVSTDNGLTWLLIDSDVHYSAAFIDNQQGWSGGNNMMYTLQGSLLSAPKGETSVTNNFTISPNPSTGVFTVSGGQLQSFTVEVYNLVGHQVLQKQSTPFVPTKLDLSNQPKGIYVVRFLSKGQAIIKRVVLQ